ncbi:MAG TPA: HAD-IA family hydrolase [Candidatus Paceibacterota bacterium]|nr:HAD-IA family hydrolase [Candidatus Paceibacterota bacterium]
MNKVRSLGAGRAFTYWEPALRQWNIPMNEREFWDYWFKAEAPSDDMIGFARMLRARGILTFLLSNNFKKRAEYYGHYPWLRDAITKAYFSWQTGAVKPDRRAWNIILDEHRLRPGECLYFDDQEKNVQAASALGIHSFLFTSVDTLKKDVAAHADAPV